jgi:endonuclease G
MNRSKKGKSRKLFKKKSRSNYKLGCIIVLIALIPILYGVYLYCQQIDSTKKEEPQANISLQIPSGKELEIPVSLTPRQEQIIHHTGYTVSYNKDLKLPNWVSYELTGKKQREKKKETTVLLPIRW